MALLASPFISPICSSRNFPNQNLFLTINSTSQLPNSHLVRKKFISTTPNFSSLGACSRNTLRFSCTLSEPTPELDHDSPSETIVFVKGLAKSTSETSLKASFSLFGDVSRVKVIADKKTGQSLGFAYIWFSNVEFAHKAIEKMNGKFFEGRFIYVTIARPGSCKAQAKAAPYKF